MLVFAVQECESAISIHISPPFKASSHLPFRSSQSAKLSSLFQTSSFTQVFYFARNSACRSMLLSLFVPPSPAPWVHQLLLCLCLRSCSADRVTSTILLGSTLPGASTRDPTHDKVMREKTWRARWIRFSRIWKAAPGAHLKDDICFSDDCFNRLLPNFCDIGRRPSSISFQIRINLEF